MTDPYDVYNTIIDVMCSHCNKTIFRKCKGQNEDMRCKVMCKCIRDILKRDDEEYPSKLPKMNKLDRVAYWKQTIAFDCPLSGKRYSVNYCFDRCEFSAAVYHDNCAWVKCGMDADGEREVHDGKPTRDN